MIRSTGTARTHDSRHVLRYGAALVGVAGAVVLAGCSPTGGGSGAEASTQPEPSTAASSGTGSTGGGGYADGTYTAEGSYQTPESIEQITVSVTLADSVITAVEVTGDPQRAESQRYQSEFISGIDGEVVGKSIDEISVSRVAGSSLTSGGFNQAIEEIKAEAKD